MPEAENKINIKEKKELIKDFEKAICKSDKVIIQKNI